MTQPAGTIPVKNEKYVENICTHTLSAAKGRPPGPLLNERPVTPVARKSTLSEFERGLRSAVGLLSRGESQGTKERKERADGGRDGRNKRLRVMAHKQKVGRVGLYCIDRVSSGVLHGRGQAGRLNTSMLRTGQVVWESVCATLDGSG